MDQKNNKDQEERSKEELEELEELIETLKKLEEERKQKEDKNKKPNMLTIEFGGVYHTNIVVNFLFQLIVNISLAYVVIQLFEFAEFKNIYMYLLFITVYSIVEGIIKTVITVRYFKYIIQSMGFILYLSYLLIFYALDVYVFKNVFTFTHAYHIVAFVTIFVILRYFIGTWIKRYLRSKVVR